MGKLRKIGKKIGRGIKSVGKKLKKGLGKVAKAFGKLGPLGSIALSFILPGIGTWISSVAQGSSFLAPIAQGLVKAGTFVKDGIGRVFNKVTDAIEYSINKVSSIGGEGVAGTNFRNWVSKTTGGFIEPSTQGVSDITVPGSTKTITKPIGKDMTGPSQQFTVEVPETTISAKSQVGIGGPKIPQTPKGMTDPVYMDGAEGGLKKGFYESADVETYYKGVDTPLGNLNLPAGQGNDVSNALKIGPRGTDTSGKMIKTTGDLKAPKPKGGGYFGRAKDAYKFVAPVTSVGVDIQAEEDAELFAQQQKDAYNRQYYSDVGQNLLGAKQSNPNMTVVNFNNPNPSDSDMYNLVNAYGGILGA
tara:strand:+ start:293 stop:1369 length:1077 start_codon:yes stop_codon:yes gene_type:complete